MRQDWQHVEGTTLQTARSVQREREEVIHTPEHRFPCSCGEDHDEGAVPLQSMEDTHARAGRCALWETAVYAGFLAGRMTSRVMCAGAVHPWKTAICRKDPCWKSLWTTITPEWDTSGWNRGRVWEGRSSRDCHELTTASISHCPIPLKTRRQRTRRKIEPEKKGGGRRCFLDFFPIFH